MMIVLCWPVQALAGLPVDLQIPADRHRVVGLTFSARQRHVACKNAELVPQDSGFIRHVKGRAVPSWRQKLMCGRS